MDAAPAEWTLDEARKHWKPMVRPVQHVGVPGYQFQAGVLWDGSLVFGPLLFRQLGVMQQELAPLGDHLLHLSVGYGDPMRFVDRRGTGNRAIRRRLEEGRLPMPHVETRDGDFLWDETVFAHLLGRQCEEGMTPRPDDVLVVHAVFRVCNAGAGPSRAHLWLHFGDTSQVKFGYKATVGDALGAALPLRFDPPFGLLRPPEEMSHPEHGGRARLLPSRLEGAEEAAQQELRPPKRPVSSDALSRVRYVIPAPSRGELAWHDAMPAPAKGSIEWSVPLPPGGEAELRLLIPYGPVDLATAMRIAALDSAALQAEVRESWQKLLDGPGQITTPDEFVNDYLAAIPGQMAQQIGYRHASKVWMYKTSPNHYEGYWPCNAAKALPALDLRGLTRLSRPVLRSFVDAQTDDVGTLGAERRPGKTGAVGGEGFERRPGFLGNFGEWTANTLLLSHGLELWALAAHYRITRDREWLGEGPGSPLLALLDGCDWLAAQRRRTMREEGGKKVPHWGLLPAASAHDWLSGNTIFNDAFCTYGLAEVVRLLREIGHPRADELARELGDYRACLRERYAEARDRARPVPLPGGSQLPYVPRDVYELDWTKIDWTYTGYGPLRAGAWGALDPNDPLVDQSLAFVENGMPKGLGPYFSGPREHPDTADANWADVSDPSAERHYLWRHYVEYETMWPIGSHLFLERDDLPRFFEWLFHNLAAVLHPEWRVGVESLDGVPSCAPGDGERWQALRSMFVNERGGHDGSQQSLWLLQAIPRSWLRPGARLGVRDMGTRFGGRVSLEVEVAKDGDSVAVSADLDLAVEPKEIRIRLRSGDGRPLRSASINGSEAPLGGKDTVSLPRELRGCYRVVGQFR